MVPFGEQRERSLRGKGGIARVLKNIKFLGLVFTI